MHSWRRQWEKLAKPKQKRLKARVDTFTYMQQVLHISFLNFFNSTKKFICFCFLISNRCYWPAAQFFTQFYLRNCLRDLVRKHMLGKDHYRWKLLLLHGAFSANISIHCFEKKYKDSYINWLSFFIQPMFLCLNKSRNHASDVFPRWTLRPSVLTHFSLQNVSNVRRRLSSFGI